MISSCFFMKNYTQVGYFCFFNTVCIFRIVAIMFCLPFICVLLYASLLNFYFMSNNFNQTKIHQKLKQVIWNLSGVQRMYFGTFINLINSLLTHRCFSSVPTHSGNLILQPQSRTVSCGWWKPQTPTSIALNKQDNIIDRWLLATDQASCQRC